MRKFPLAIRPPGFVIRCPFSKCKGHFMYNKLTSLSPSLSEFLQPGLHPSPEEDSVQLPAGVSVRCHPEQLPQLLWWLRDRSGWEGGHRKPAAPAERGHSDCSEWRGPWDTCSGLLGWSIPPCVQSPCWRLMPAESFVLLGYGWEGGDTDGEIFTTVFHNSFKYSQE